MTAVGALLGALLTGAPSAEAADPTAAPAAGAQVPAVIPAPVSLTPLPGKPFELTADTRIVVHGPEETRSVGDYLAGLLRPATGYPLPVVHQPDETGAVPQSITLRLSGTKRLGAEGYRLDVTRGKVMLSARTTEGLFRGVQTLRQLFPPKVEAGTAQSGPWQVPGVHVVDHPRFTWRGAMLDVARHFFTVDEVKRYIDLLTLYKINTLHLHLSDDQGWRIQIDSWPRLATYGGSTEVGGGPGGYYTKDDYREIVRYAADRYITIVPEIDMPGHTNAALASYAELNCDGVAPPLYTGTSVGFSSLCIDKEITYEFIDDVVREVAALTPGPYFHIGGDEAHATEHEDYVRFVRRVEGIVHSHGKRMLGWEEISGVGPDSSSVAQHWFTDSEALDAADLGMSVVMSPAEKVYIDMKYNASTELGLTWAGYSDVRDSYEWDPGTWVEGLPEEAILGPEAPLWGETIEDIDDIEFLAFPRIPGVAERGWSPAAGRSWDEYSDRLGIHGLRWDVMSVNYYRSPLVPWGGRVRTVSAEVPPRVVFGDDGSVELPVEVGNDTATAAEDITVEVGVAGQATVEPQAATLPRLGPGRARTVRFALSWPDGARARAADLVVRLSWSQDGQSQSTTMPSPLEVTCAEEVTSPAALTYADSEETEGEDGAASNAIDGDPDTLWHTQWQAADPPHPHELHLDLGQPMQVCALRYLPRQSGSTNGTVAGYEVYLSADGANWGDPVAAGEFSGGRDEKWVPFGQTTARYVRFVALSEVNGNPWTSAAELSVDAR